MIALFIVFALAAVHSQEEFFPDVAVMAKDSTLANMLLDAAQSLIVFVRCGRLGCPKDEMTPFISVANMGEATVVDDNADLSLMCNITTYRVTKKRTGESGRGVSYEADIFGQSNTGRLYLVHTLDLAYLKSKGVDVFADVEKQFPYGSETLCLPEILRRTL